jgi:hypothetical protein
MSLPGPSTIDRLIGPNSRGDRPRAITPPGGGGKFAPDGTLLPFPGNTILCHIDPASAAHRALTDMQERCKAADWAANFAFLPTASFHMTVFEGVCMNPIYREDWPQGVSRNATRNEVSHVMLDRLRDVYLPSRAKVRPVGVRHNAGIGVLVDGADEANERLLRATRSQLSEALGYRPANFAEYRFHITLAYLLHWLDEDLAQRVGGEVEAALHDLARAVPEIELGPPEFCNFDTMHEFVPLRLLDRAPLVAAGN